MYIDSSCLSNRFPEGTKCGPVRNRAPMDVALESTCVHLSDRFYFSLHLYCLFSIGICAV